VHIVLFVMPKYPVVLTNKPSNPNPSSGSGKFLHRVCSVGFLSLRLGLL
jgi:hypothetical protein